MSKPLMAQKYKISRSARSDKYRPTRSAGQIAVALLLVILIRHGASAQDDLAAKAQNERELSVYGTALVAQFDKFVEPFRRRYPFIKTQYSRTTGEALTSKILREVQTHQLGADVVLINNYTHRIFMKRNIITAYAPPSAANFPPGFIDKQGYWVGFYLVPYAITYNTKLVPKASAPKSFDDLLNPKWKGGISLEREEYLVTQSHMQYLGRQKALEYFKKLAQQDLVLINGHSNQAMLLTAGEFPIIIYSDIARTEELKRKGAPIEWVRAEPHITVLVSAAITREARHPAAARLFMNYLASDEGQKEV
ncbi:MAG TPA: extracellular solute-binding protein, partial [Phototrophicaceae bacterium]|nr:extracellular solute-binding protein [Phototrophicaceae bacterium]